MENPPKIWDAVRRRWLVLTPEEWVRQHLIRLLVERGGVPPGNVSQEYPVALSGAAQRADVVVTGRDGRPCLLAECKAPDVPLGSRSVRSGRAVQQRRGGPLCTDNDGCCIAAAASIVLPDAMRSWKACPIYPHFWGFSN